MTLVQAHHWPGIRVWTVTETNTRLAPGTRTPEAGLVSASESLSRCFKLPGLAAALAVSTNLLTVARLVPEYEVMRPAPFRPFCSLEFMTR
jgi:hypothetical protein